MQQSNATATHLTAGPGSESNLALLNKTEDAVPDDPANPPLPHVREETGAEIFVEMLLVMLNNPSEQHWGMENKVGAHLFKSRLLST